MGLSSREIMVKCEKRLEQTIKNIGTSKSQSGFAAQGIIIGMNYFENTTLTFMVVGRALNGWERPSEYDFKWLTDKVSDHYDRPQNTNWHNKSSFWRCAKKMYSKLFDLENFANSDEYEYLNYIAWTNLYKIAPQKKNPNNKLCIAQLRDCIDLLAYEIESTKPRYIWFNTGADWPYAFIGWGEEWPKIDRPDDIFTAFTDAKNKGQWEEFEENNYVLAVRQIIWCDDSLTIMIVTKRCEGKNEVDFVEEVSAILLGRRRSNK